MDIQVILQAVSTVGFPIVMCGVMCYYIKYSGDKNREQYTDMMKEHREETDNLKTAIENNTRVLETLRTLLDK